MKRAVGLLLVAAMVGSTGGCSIIDRLFLANFDGPYAHHRHGGCRDGACQDGACQDGACVDGACADGACADGACADGACATGPCPAGLCKGGPGCRHQGRYGGLAKHHLTPEEEAALAASDYGQTGPAGPPTGAVAYPYYTTRGPRDFLAKRPPSIGP